MFVLPRCEEREMDHVNRRGAVRMRWFGPLRRHSAGRPRTLATPNTERQNCQHLHFLTALVRARAAGLLHARATSRVTRTKSNNLHIHIPRRCCPRLYFPNPLQRTGPPQRLFSILAGGHCYQAGTGADKGSCWLGYSVPVFEHGLCGERV